jgi:hypothetical protein
VYIPGNIAQIVHEINENITEKNRTHLWDHEG